MDGWIFVGLWPMNMGEVVGPLGAKGNLASLNRIQHEQPKTMVETIYLPKLVESGAFQKTFAVGNQKRMTVAI